MKTCFKCGVPKDLSEFYRHSRMADGHLNKCKGCTKQDVGSNYALRREKYSEYDKRRGAAPERKGDKAVALKRYRSKNPEKNKARQDVARALRTGKLTKQPCRYCGTTDNVQAHHADYSKPLDVVWECFKHHREREHGQTVTRSDSSDRK